MLSFKSALQVVGSLLFVTVTLSALVAIQAHRQETPEGEAYTNDAIQFWSAGQLVRQGRSPHDVAGQTGIGRSIGWDRDQNGGGVYDFMPYFYPYWVALVSVPLSLLSLKYATALVTVLGYLAAVAAAYLLSRMNDWMPRLACLLIIVLFPMTSQAAEMGQVATFFLLGATLVWWCGQHGRDLLAGSALALLCTKPQLALILVPCVLLWSFRQARWQIVYGFVGGLASLLAISFLFRPEWLMEFLKAPSITPMVTGDRPGMVTSWLALMKLAGFEGPTLMVLCIAAAVPAVVWPLVQAWRRDAKLEDAISVGLLTIWFISPYARSYDMPVLLFPLMVLLRQVAFAPRFCLVVLFTLVAHNHQFIRWQREAYPVWGMEIWWIWMPIVLLAAWVSRGRMTSWSAEWGPWEQASSAPPETEASPNYLPSPGGIV